MIIPEEIGEQVIPQQQVAETIHGAQKFSQIGGDAAEKLIRSAVDTQLYSSCRMMVILANPTIFNFLHLIFNKRHFFRHLLNFCCPATIFLGRCGIWIAHRSDHLGHDTTSWQFSRSTSPSGEGHEHSGDVLSGFSRWRSSGMVWNLLAQWVRKPFPEGRAVSPQLGEAWFCWNKSMSLWFIYSFAVWIFSKHFTTPDSTLLALKARWSTSTRTSWEETRPTKFETVCVWQGKPCMGAGVWSACGVCSNWQPPEFLSLTYFPKSKCTHCTLMGSYFQTPSLTLCAHSA